MICYVFIFQATITKFNKLKLTNSNTHILATLDKLGQNHDLDLVKSKEKICQQMDGLKKAQAVHIDLLSKHASHGNCTSACLAELASSRREVVWTEESISPWFCHLLWQFGYPSLKEKYDHACSKSGLSLDKSSNGRKQNCWGTFRFRKAQSKSTRGLKS